MAKNVSKDAVFLIDDNGGTERDISSAVSGVDGLPGERELVEKTALGDSGRSHVPGLENGTITLEGQFDDTSSTGTDTVLGPLRTDTTARTFKYGPQGSATNDIRYTGTCFVRNYVVTARIGEIVAFRCELAVQGTVTRDTF